jgi:hypothetical protein
MRKRQRRSVDTRKISWKLFASMRADTGTAVRTRKTILVSFPRCFGPLKPFRSRYSHRHHRDRVSTAVMPDGRSHGPPCAESTVKVCRCPRDWLRLDNCEGGRPAPRSLYTGATQKESATSLSSLFSVGSMALPSGKMFATLPLGKARCFGPCFRFLF